MPSTQPNFKEFPLTYEKGLVTEIEPSVLELGQVAVLENWEPTAQGGLRVRNTWDTISKAGLPSTYKVRGFGAIASGAATAGATAPIVVQDSSWPDVADTDPVTTRTQTLTGCTIGNVIVAVVSDDSGETPTIGGTGGFTQRAISTAERQYVKFYTKTAAASTETFIYTITTSKIRAVTLYEISGLDSEDPGIKWAAAHTNTGSGGSNTLTVTATDNDGGLAITGYLYDGGTPDTAVGGTAGMTAVIQDNANTRTGVSFEDLDQLDGTSDAQTYVTPSWTPPDSGALLAIITAGETGTGLSPTISGNGLTWTSQYLFNDQLSYEVMHAVFSADLGQAGKTTGAITVDMGVDSFTGAGEAWTVSFVRVLGAAADPVVQVVQASPAGGASPITNQIIGTLAALQSGSAVLGVLRSFVNVNPATDTITATVGAGDWSGVFDDQTVRGVRSVLAYQTAANADVNGGRFSTTASGTLLHGFLMEIAGVGNAAKASHGTFTAPGTVTDTYDYVANKSIVAKMVVWGYTPPAVSDDSIQFYIVMALATGPTTYQIYRILRDSITSGTWTLIDQVTDAASSDAWASFAQGAGKLVWSSSSLQAPRVITLNPLAATGITPLLGKSGRCVAYHKDRMFVAGSTLNPSRLYFSDIGDPTDFTTLTDYLDIGGDDGEAIQDILSVEGLLLVCKTNRLYLVSGSGIETFFVNELPGGSAASGRCVVRTPYGTIVAGVDDIWVVQGGAVDPMSRPLGAGYRITGNVSCAYAQDSVLIADSGSGQVWRANLITGAWMLEPTAPTNTPNPVYTVFSLNGRLYYGTNNSTTQVGGTRQLSTARNYDATTGGLVLQADTGRMSLMGPSYKYTPRFLWLQLRNQSPSAPNELLVTVESELGIEEHSIRVTSSTQRERRDLGRHKGAQWLRVAYRAASSLEHGAIDVEKSVLGMLTETYR